ncbi:hypothetical protein A6R68_20336 [Neotoma lepida]|uniref:Ribosomal protein L10e/L16 domain-containing protein n=1 Tax=Neotoma lepida TaxID=56216 RepID=A0A1A6HTX7_NEOLE|nr:hypothetical protein A6R68_20336 [Neotoma lepida]
MKLTRTLTPLERNRAEQRDDLQPFTVMTPGYNYTQETCVMGWREKKPKPIPKIDNQISIPRDAYGGSSGLLNIWCSVDNKEHVTEALRRAKFKFPGHLKIHISKQWDFTKFNADDFEDMVTKKWLTLDGCGAKYVSSSSPLDKPDPSGVPKAGPGFSCRSGEAQQLWRKEPSPWDATRPDLSTWPEAAPGIQLPKTKKTTFLGLSCPPREH